MEALDERVLRGSVGELARAERDGKLDARLPERMIADFRRLRDGSILSITNCATSSGMNF
jgi:hypothetical protein